MEKIEVSRDGIIKAINPKNLTLHELCYLLANIRVGGGGWLPYETERQGYAAIKEAIRRLKEREEK